MPKPSSEAKVLLQFRADPFFAERLRQLVKITPLDEADHLRAALSMYLIATARMIQLCGEKGWKSCELGPDRLASVAVQSLVPDVARGRDQKLIDASGV